MNKQTFRKDERLCSQTIIDRLFEKGSTLAKTFYLFPFKVFYICEPTDKPTQVLFSVSKRHFKHAVDRNLLRRRCKEAYRKNKNLLLQNGTQPAYIAFVFIAKDKVDYQKIDNSMKNLLPKLT